MRTLTVNAPSRAYDVTIGGFAAALLPEVLAKLGHSRAAIVTDLTVNELHGGSVFRALRDAGIDVLLTALPPGEEHKTLASVEWLYHQFTAFELKRNDCVVALGGGVVGDMAGFAAATYMRGVSVVQVPTTLVAQVDSSIGGKTGVNLGEGKNLVGAFHQPSAVLADMEMLGTLPARELRAGLAEVAKYYALGAAELRGLLTADVVDLEAAVHLCCAAKARYVAEDERDTGARMALNLGHTFAHAIEKYYNYSEYNHGEAVALGLELALAVGERLCVTPHETARDVRELMDALGLNRELDLDARELIPLMAGDKKNTDGDLTLILLSDLGAPVARKLSAAQLAEVL
jgi:3-dehydroquinate synthase